MNEAVTSIHALRQPRPDIARGKRARMARMVVRSGTLGLLQRARDAVLGGVRILAYHRVLESAEPPGFLFDPGLISASACAFDAQMAVLKRSYHPMSLAQVLAAIEEGKTLPDGAVVVTFDDGYEDNCRIALPILRKHGVPATFFVSSAHIDSGAPYAFDWLYHMVCTAGGASCDVPQLGIQAIVPDGLADRRVLAAHLLDRIKLLDPDGQEAVIRALEREWGMARPASAALCRPMTWDEVRQLHAAGMEIGSHGMHHNMLSKLADDALEEELSQSRATIHAQVGVRPAAISYPVGGLDAFDGRVIQAARDNGYRIGCSYLSGVDRPSPSNLMSLRRIPIERDMDLAWFEALLGLPETFAHTSRLRRA